MARHTGTGRESSKVPINTNPRVTSHMARHTDIWQGKAQRSLQTPIPLFHSFSPSLILSLLPSHSLTLLFLHFPTLFPPRTLSFSRQLTPSPSPSHPLTSSLLPLPLFYSFTLSLPHHLPPSHLTTSSLTLTLPHPCHATLALSLSVSLLLPPVSLCVCLSLSVSQSLSEN